MYQFTCFPGLCQLTLMGKSGEHKNLKRGYDMVWQTNGLDSLRGIATEEELEALRLNAQENQSTYDVSQESK